MTRTYLHIRKLSPKLTPAQAWILATRMHGGAK
jgi:hypothetical protein